MAVVQAFEEFRNGLLGLPARPTVEEPVEDVVPGQRAADLVVLVVVAELGEVHDAVLEVVAALPVDLEHHAVFGPH